MTKLRRNLRALGLLFILSFSVFFWCQNFIFSSNTASAFEYIVKPGTTIDRLSLDLMERGYFQQRYQAYLFIAYGYLSKKAYHLKAGEYHFEANVSPEQLLQKIVKGQVFLRSVTVIEGTHSADFLNLLKTTPYFKHDASLLSEAELKTRLHIPANQALEGLFFPSTYKYARNSSDWSIVTLAYNTLQKHLATEWQNRAANLPYKTPYEALIVASLIQEEAKLAVEQPLIAGVILKRLSINMPLQIDASVIYGLGPLYKNKLTHEQVQQDTAYNTYTRKGLPPTPIALVGLSALHAALHPIINDNLFYVARGDGSHQFSATFELHQAAVQKFLKPTLKIQKNK